jgi:hypothetical protein
MNIDSQILLGRVGNPLGRRLGSLLACCCILAGSHALHAQVRAVPNPTPQAVFGGEQRFIRVHFENPSPDEQVDEVRARLLQLTSATAVPIRITPWKTLRMLPGQEVVERFETEFPAVKTETRFAIQWLDEGGRVMGRTDVRVFPARPLGGLKALLDGSAVGVVDPADRIPSVLREAGLEVEVVDIEALARFEGKLLIIGPKDGMTSVPDGLGTDLLRLARKGVAVVWLVAPDPGKPLGPSFQRMAEGNGTLMIVDPTLVEELATSPLAQKNLLQLATQALRPVPSAPPGSDPNE